MTAQRGYLVVEGQGEQSGAANNLVVRLWADLGLSPTVFWSPAMRGPGIGSERVLRETCESIRVRGDASLLLVLRDEDDACVRETGPRASTVLDALGLPFPSAVVLFEREFESLFLASLPSLAGKPLTVGNVDRAGISHDASFDGAAHTIRDAKRRVSQLLEGDGRRYKPTVDQKPLTRLVDFELVRSSGLPWFRTLERALRFLDANLGGRGVYPPPPREADARGA